MSRHTGTVSDVDEDAIMNEAGPVIDRPRSASQLQEFHSDDVVEIYGEVTGRPSLELPPLSPIVKEYEIRRRNQATLSLIPGQSRLLASTSLFKASRLLHNPPKAPLWLPFVTTVTGMPWTINYPESGDWASQCLMRVRQPGAKLCTTEIDWGMDVCRKQCPLMDGLQSEIVYSPCMVDPVYVPQRKFVQILNVGDHWVTASNFFSRTPDFLKIYDSGYSRIRYGFQQQEQISRLLRPAGNQFGIEFSNVQQQSPHSNLCGHYSIVFSWALCGGYHPEQVAIDETAVRDDVANVMEAHMLGNDAQYRFPPCEPGQWQEALIVYVCAVCKLACEEKPCFVCNKRSHTGCQWRHRYGFTTDLKKLRCKACML